MSVLMVTVGAAALVANLFCLVLVTRRRDGCVHIRASLIFSSNDTLANAGVTLAGAADRHDHQPAGVAR